METLSTRPIYFKLIPYSLYVMWPEFKTISLDIIILRYTILCTVAADNNCMSLEIYLPVCSKNSYVGINYILSQCMGRSKEKTGQYGSYSPGNN